MKRAIAPIVAQVFLLSLIIAAPQNIFADNPEGMIVAYVNIPDGWENPCIWAWDDAGNNAFSAWPGNEAEADPNNAGWYYCYLPNWITNVIVNANNGTVQTDTLKAEGQTNFWLTVKSPNEVLISFNALTIGEAPEYVEKITVNAKVPADWENPHLWAWSSPQWTNVFNDWPGGGMSGASGGWYSIKAPNWLNFVIINANNGSVQTADLNVEQGKEIWVVVADDFSVKVYYENPDLIVANITVRTKVPASWEGPRLWAWLHPEGKNIFDSWPGQPFTRNGDWYEISLPGWVNSFIVNANDGSIQTGNISELDTGRDIWIVVTDAENYTYYYADDTALLQTAPASKASPVIWIVLAVVCVVVIAVILVVIIKKKK